ncbi:MAG: BMP family ABC transporter substrate-binding protein, partial [Bacteroidota bacterium]
MKKLYVLLAALLIATMVLTACGKPATTPPPAVPPSLAPATEPLATEPAATEPAATKPAAKFTVGEVSDFGGVDDKSFNQMAWEGLQKATTDLGVDGKFLESKVQSDYAKNMQQFVSEGANMVVTVGFNMGIDTANA